VPGYVEWRGKSRQNRIKHCKRGTERRTDSSVSGIFYLSGVLQDSPHSLRWERSDKSSQNPQLFCKPVLLIREARILGAKSIRRDTMKGTLLTVALLVFAGSTSAMAQKSYKWVNRDHGRQWATHGHHYDRYRGSDYDRYRDMHQDERAIEHDKWEIRDDIRHGDYRAARREREELRERERDLYRDRRGSYDPAWRQNQRWDPARFADFLWR
jgi:hypothetical protein